MVKKMLGEDTGVECLGVAEFANPRVLHLYNDIVVAFIFRTGIALLVEDPVNPHVFLICG